MNRSAQEQLLNQAKQVLVDNDRGHYTVPTHGLYPFQWNWDSCLSALGQMHFDEDRAWTEIETLFDHQWDDGMVPHIIFHQDDDGYFPGPDVWQTYKIIPTSGITQPAVAGFAIKRLFDRSNNKELAAKRVLDLLPKVSRWHEWFYENRDPEKTGLVAIIHPWESGRDNSIDWDVAFERIPTEGVNGYNRRDTDHANPAHRPTKAQYDRYIWLVQHFRSLKWDNSLLHNESPFQIVDPGFNAILLRSCQDLSDLAKSLGEDDIATKNATFATKGNAQLESLWSEKYGQYLCFDRYSKELIDSPSIGGILSVFGCNDAKRAKKIANRIQQIEAKCHYIIPSHDPDSEKFDGGRYWRGPVWLIVNYMIVDGLIRNGESDVASKIIKSSLELIETGGMAEYYDPHTGQGCGGGHFTWTAAMVIEFLSMTKN